MTTAAIQRIMNVAVDLPDEAEGPVINFMVRFRNPEQTRRTDISDSGLDFGSEFTDENHDKRVSQFFALSEGIEVDEQAIEYLREASMI